MIYSYLLYFIQSTYTEITVDCMKHIQNRLSQLQGLKRFSMMIQTYVIFKKVRVCGIGK